MNETVVIDKIRIDGVVFDSLKLTKMMFSDYCTKHHINLIFALLSLYNDNDKAVSYKIKIKELCKIYSPTNARIKDIKQLTKKAAEDLMDLQFTIPNKGKKTLKLHHWVETVEIPENPSDDDYAEIVLGKGIEEYFSQIKEQNLVYSLKYILALSTLTEAKIYRWAYSKKGFNNDVPISIEDAKLLFVGKTTINTTDFIRYPLTSAIKKINKKTDLHIEFEPVRADSTYKTKITSLKFKIHCKCSPKKARTDSQKKSDKERTKALWQTANDQAKIIEQQEQTIQAQQDQISKLTNENFLVQENKELQAENLKLKLQRASYTKNRA